MVDEINDFITHSSSNTRLGDLEFEEFLFIIARSCHATDINPCNCLDIVK